jgi:N-acetylglucosaminyldiphosphoundecaprenol N-acetyl-beta-D-mannosaminyltransferase
MIQAINEARADILFACLGTPKQEKWIAQNAKKLNVSVCVGVGCALDILSGRAVEAPRALTGIGMEWLFRLMHEPRRLAKRYLIRGSAFIYYVLKQRLGI